ncbi:MAG: TonB C-terminal domain-containing protein [Kiritimatiellaeota bacterium]|nr:TonB C-terminal domain-containing protein [Kiritimatiellota bacterium]
MRSSERRRTRSVPALPSVSPDTIASRISRKVNRLRLTVPGGASTPRSTEAFFSALSAVLYRLWRQPDRSAVGSGRPTVHASVTVDAFGRLVAVRLTGPSGIPAMDESVKAALARIGRLPAPRDFGVPEARLTVDIAFELD